ncbi:MAG TPA: 4Fe-4S dicluster domain-containing protein [Candidatus Nanoarchaeia archaeon]|nr:4Fe-4S dicluster domain-containing protein [Candidatus Nanoarchaeia archaeon]
MHKAFISPQDCLRCSKCLAAAACPVKAIFRIDADEIAIVEPNICHGCGDCVPKCFANAITLKEN